MWKEERQSKQQELKWTQKSLSHKPLSVWNEFGTWRGFDLLYCVLEWMLELLYWMWYLENLDAWSYGGWGVFIAPNHFGSRWGGCWRWAHGTGTVRCLVRRHVTQPLGFRAKSTVGALSSCGTGQSGALWLRDFDFCHDTVVHYNTLQSRPLALNSRCPLAHRTVRWQPDSLVNYSGACLHFSESGWLTLVRSWCTGHCPVRQSTAHSSPFAPFKIVSLTWIFYWFVLNLMHL
jgi:hypothetical protein